MKAKDNLFTDCSKDHSGRYVEKLEREIGRRGKSR